MTALRYGAPGPVIHSASAPKGVGPVASITIAVLTVVAINLPGAVSPFPLLSSFFVVHLFSSASPSSARSRDADGFVDAGQWFVLAGITEGYQG